MKGEKVNIKTNVEIFETAKELDTTPEELAMDAFLRGVSHLLRLQTHIETNEETTKKETKANEVIVTSRKS